MKYTVKTSGKICHYQFSNIKEIEVNDIEFGEMDYHELEETFLLDKCSVENEKISMDDEIEFEIYDETNNLILESFFWNDSTILIVLSFEQSSVINNSQFIYVWFIIELIVSEINLSELYDGVIIETSSFTFS